MSLSVEDLRVSAGRTELLQPVSFAVAPGEPLTILGETGAGKSLLAQAIMGALPRGLVCDGAVTLDGARIDTLARRKREALWGRRIALLPQEPWRALDPLMASARQVAETHVAVLGRSRAEGRAKARDALAALGLGSAAMAARPDTLSGGMAQRVAFAAATAAGAGTLLVDEPTKGLDAARRDDVVRLLRAVVEGGGVLITITHDVGVARALGGRAMILRRGAVVEAGPTDRLLRAPRSAYGRALVAADPETWPDLVPDDRGAAPVLTAERLSIARGGRPLAEGIALSLAARGRVAVTAPSGFGKTTLLDTLAGLLPPRAGEVRRHGRAAAPFALQKLYQDPPAAFPPRARLSETLGDVERRHGLPPGRIGSLMARLGLAPELLARRPAEVSGGELQRLALARVLALRPGVILADEPTSRLDPVTQRAVMETLAEAAAEAGAGVLLVTHNATIARRWAGAVLALDDFAPARRTAA